VFCNRKTEVDIVAKSLASHGFDAAPIHGDLPQSQRTQTLDRFRNKELKLLVASDVAARGLDIPEVSQVFNYAPPPNSDDYVHRIGRTGRAGRTGESFTIVSPGDSRLWEAVLKRIGRDVEPFSPEGLDEAVGEARSRGPAPRRDRFDRKRGRGRGEDRGPAPRGEDRPPRAETPASAPVAEPELIEAAPEMVDEPVEMAVSTEAATDKPAREGRNRKRRGGRDRERGGEREQPREQSQSRERAPEREGKNRHGELKPGAPQGGNDSFKGMGDHVPAFLLQSLGKRRGA
jgi:superfamily II DNA/RNA helicase